MISVEDLDDDEYEEARERFAALQAKAAASEHSLTRTSRGFMLVRGSSSWFSGDLNAIAHVLSGKVAT